MGDKSNPSPSSTPLFTSSFFRRKPSASPRNTHSPSPALCPLNMSVVTYDNSELNILELTENFKKNVTVKDRRYRLSVYKDCFLGSEAVQWLVTSGTAQNRQDAVKLGLLMQEAGLIEHCLRDHE